MEFTVTLVEKLDPIAVYAAFVATIILIWDVIKWYRRGARLRLRVNPGMKMFGVGTEQYEGRTYILVIVSNVGSATTTITHLAGCQFKDHWKRIRNQPETAFVILTPQTAPHQTVPFVLEPGKEWTGMIEQNDEVEGLVRDGLLYAEVHHSVAKRPVRKRILISEKDEKKSEDNSQGGK